MPSAAVVISGGVSSWGCLLGGQPGGGLPRGCIQGAFPMMADPFAAYSQYAAMGG